MTEARTTTSLWTFPLRSTGCHITCAPKISNPTCMIIWHDAKCAVYLVELTCPFEENFIDAAIRKDTRYHDLADTARSDGVQCTIWPVQVGSWGMIDQDRFKNLLLFLGLPVSAVADLFFSLSGIALRESFSVWCSRNRPSDSLGT